MRHLVRVCVRAQVEMVEVQVTGELDEWVCV